MKKHLILIIILCSSFGKLKAQQSVLFKLKYLPDHLYRSEMGMDMNMEMDIFGDMNTMQALKQEGMQLPMMIVQETNMQISAKTGSPGPDNSFPVKLSYDSIKTVKTINGEDTPGQLNPLAGQTIYAVYSGDGKIRIDSISGKTLDDSLKVILTNSLEKLINSIKFPDKPLTIGDTFTQTVPFNLPIAGLNMQMNIKVTYKLTSIENGMADFDINQTMDMNFSTVTNGKDVKGTGTGNGTGKLVYDIGQNFPENMNSVFGFDFQMSMGTINFKAKAKMTSSYQTQITTLAQ